MYNYSAKNNAFYPESARSNYELHGSWPSDCVSVPSSVYDEFSASVPPSGKVRVAGGNGLPCWADIPAPTKEELISVAEAEKTQLLNAAQRTISIWQTELQLGIIEDADKAKLTNWLLYIKKLNLVDTGSAPDIEWPDTPAN